MKPSPSRPLVVGSALAFVLVLLALASCPLVEASQFSLPSTRGHPTSPLSEFFNSTDLKTHVPMGGTFDTVHLFLLCISLIAPLLCLSQGGCATKVPQAAPEETSLLQAEEEVVEEEHQEPLL